MSTSEKTKQNKIAPNKLETVKRQIKRSVLEAINIPEEIDAAEKDYYHILIIESNPNLITKEYEHKARKQVYDDRSWLVGKKQLKQLGYDQVYILHDPKTIEKNKESRAEILEKAISLGYDGAKNVKTEVLLNFIAEAEEKS